MTSISRSSGPGQVSSVDGAPFDPRSICNLMLDQAAGVSITNLALQKLLYFVHGIHLIETKKPLVMGYFEAWQHGPVHPAAYNAFKSAGKAPILFRATRRNPLTGEDLPISSICDQDVKGRLRRVMALYGRMNAGNLVDISHAPGAPWHFIVTKARATTAFGMRIPDDVIVERFKYHKVSVGPTPLHGEPSEDAPFA